jgi:hypothetical protein
MTTSERFTVLTGGPTVDERRARLTAGADEVAQEERRPSVLTHPRLLLGVSAALMVAGVLAILLGWDGAANATVVEEQVPYLVSGGLLGVALATIGALTFFANWLTVAIREARAHEAARHRDHLELMAAVSSLAGALSHQEDTTDGRARSPRSERPVRRAPRRT